MIKSNINVVLELLTPINNDRKVENPAKWRNRHFENQGQ